MEFIILRQRRREEKKGMLKVLLVGINSKYIHSNLAIRYLKAFTRELDYEAVLKEYTINDRIENILQDIILSKPDIVAFSCYIWNIDYVSKITELIKRVDKSIEIVYGGPEVSYDSFETMRINKADYVIEGEGEETYREFILYKLGKMSISEIRGIYYRENEDILYKGGRSLMDIESVVFPYEENENMLNKIVYYEASRGCPFNCKYCLSSTVHGVRFLNVERVKKELAFLIKSGVKLIKFVDRTFNCNHEFAMSIWKYLIEQDTETCFHFEISADLLKEKEIALLAKAPKGRFQFEVGVQTTNDKVLKNINRYVNFQDIKDKVIELEKIKNIKQHLDLIAGLPGEDFDSFKNSFNELYSIGPEEIQLGFLKLLKGSSMREEAEKWGMEYSPYPPYEILKSNTMSYNELLELKKAEAMVDKYYNSGKFNNIINFLINKFAAPFDFYMTLGNYFYEKGYFARSISNTEYYKVFKDFHEKFFEGYAAATAMEDIIKYDYLRFNKKRGVPDILRKSITKEEEYKLKRKMQEIINFNDVYVDKFNIDIPKFIKSGEINFTPSYIIFDLRNEDNIIDTIYSI
ncbi:B12-binding domain-containing radical SAM protein [Clostridium polynesiense]|uniref:B12-binding domain-containing radical SAM protein n=1 Tax=Clostridium polynesiense TaxID=1325933 RepID=UPI001FA6F053|nr:B12-binding domain-containing radical SAM protein [Clostridium polynesiense]